MARKPRDYDAEIQSLLEKAKKVKNQKTIQLGELVQIVGVDGLSFEMLAGVLIEAVEHAKAHPEKAAGWTDTGKAFLETGGKRGKKAQPANAAAGTKGG